MKSILSLPGVGAQKGAKLNEAGIFTLEDLLQRQDPIAGIDLQKLKTAARVVLGTTEEVKHEDDCWMTEKHAWWYLNVHRCSKSGRLVNTKVYRLMVDKGGVYMMVGRDKEKKRITPLMIAALYRLWAVDELISDDDGLLEVQKALPVLKVEDLPKEKWQQSALRAMIREVNQLLKII